MPYISKYDRPEIDSGKKDPQTAGELNYKLTTIIIDYLEQYGVSYKAINDVLGALEGAKLEFYRRVAVPYEDAKIAVNTDVYPLSITGGKTK
jgi:hypothetical protein